MSDCLFCGIVAGDVDAEIVHEEDDVVAFDDINPQAPTHVLIVPRQHIPTTNDVEPAHHALVGRMVELAGEIAADRGIAESGYRLVFNCNRGAGQSVFHIHLHLLGGRAMRWPPG